MAGVFDPSINGYGPVYDPSMGLFPPMVPPIDPSINTANSINGTIPPLLPTNDPSINTVPGGSSTGLPLQQRPVDPGVFGLPGLHSPQAGLPVPIPSTTQGSPIEHVIASLGIHPQSGLASAFRAIHAVLAHHLASQAAAHYGHAGLGSVGGHPGGPVRPGPTLQ